ncbi:MAG: RNA methyltransferase [Paludibacteraceae bacterium]|jgi:tRNA G18 (ribose-2'-O)-methylase SpoU|nr:RNA methyltransferase [Paludibacteraceae bacterium]MED9995669.1 RNA methyltransferase [Paludibacteraceae bacterium]
MRKLTVTELERIDIDTFKQSQKIPLVMVLDNVRSLHNVGSVFRTADAFRVEHICLCGITATPPNAEIHKTALGAENSVEWTFFEDTMDAVNHLKEQGYILFAVEQAQNSISLPNLQLDPTKRYALIVGNEVKGVQQQVVDACHGCIEIPQFGTKHSLNVSVASGLVMWDAFKQLYETINRN